MLIFKPLLLNKRTSGSLCWVWKFAMEREFSLLPREEVMHIVSQTTNLGQDVTWESETPFF